MGWSIGFDEKWKREVGYGVPAYCDHPNCVNKIDRGVEQACGGVPDFAGHGCGLRFCERHLDYSYTADGMDDLVDEKGESYPRRCERCIEGREPFAAKEDHPEWIAWKLSDASWLGWRTENPQEVDRLKRVLAEVR